MIQGLEHLSYDERAGTVQPAEEQALGDLSSVHRYLKEGEMKTEPDSSQWCPVRGQEAMGTH